MSFAKWISRTNVCRAQVVENIGARRLHTIMEKLLEEISFEATDRSGETIHINKEYVEKRVSDLAKDADLSKFIL